MQEHFQSYIKALNDHKVEKALDHLSKDFELYFTEYNIKIKKKEYVDVLGWDKGSNGKVEYEDLKLDGNTVTAVFTERNDFLSLIGIESLKATISYKFDDSGKINRQTYTPFPDQPSTQDKLENCISWAKKNRPEALKEVYPNDQLQFNQEMAKKWVALLEDWRSAMN